jgi:hypothetical protein
MFISDLFIFSVNIISVSNHSKYISSALATHPLYIKNRPFISGSNMAQIAG